MNRSGWEQEGIRHVAQEAWTLIAETGGGAGMNDRRRYSTVLYFKASGETAGDGCSLLGRRIRTVFHLTRCSAIYHIPRLPHYERGNGTLPDIDSLALACVSSASEPMSDAPP